jgi:hypothetical protein
MVAVRLREGLGECDRHGVERCEEWMDDGEEGKVDGALGLKMEPPSP